MISDVLPYLTLPAGRCHQYGTGCEHYL